MSDSLSRNQALQQAFRMPNVQTPTSRISSITNAFVNAIVPAIPPTPNEIAKALKILEMDPANVLCAYCGDKSSEWDHLNPLVLNRRPTGFITEIGNLVPACGKCNQSKGNKPWRSWMLSDARNSPTGRKLRGVDVRIARLKRYETWRKARKIDFASIVGQQRWKEFWELCENITEQLKKDQQIANEIRADIAKAVAGGERTAR